MGASKAISLIYLSLILWEVELDDRIIAGKEIALGVRMIIELDWLSSTSIMSGTVHDIC